MISREAWQAVPRFDDGYFLYFEEADYCRRVREAGFEVMHVPTASYVHIKGVSTGVGAAGQEEAPLPPYWYESWRRYHLRNEGRAGAIGIGAATLGRVAVRRLFGKSAGGIVPKDFWQIALKPALRGEQA
jgi:GT2 family glycosyltransferase